MTHDSHPQPLTEISALRGDGVQFVSIGKRQSIGARAVPARSIVDCEIGHVTILAPLSDRRCCEPRTARAPWLGRRAPQQVAAPRSNLDRCPRIRLSVYRTSMNMRPVNFL